MLSTLRGLASQAKQALTNGQDKGAQAQTWMRTGFERDLLKSAVVLNSNDDVLNREVLALLLQTIFADCPQYIDIVGSRLQALDGASTIGAVEAAIEKIVLEALSKGEWQSETMAAAFYQHKVRSAANSRAYSPAGRVNANAVFWPNPVHPESPRSLHDELPYVQPIPLINKNTKIVSMGSCFAIEIAYALQKEGYNYVVKEPNIAADGSWWYQYHETAEHVQSSAAWGTHFNTPSFLQVVEKAFGYRRPAKILWTNMGSKGQIVYCDPFREEFQFASVEAFEANYEVHIAAAREALLEAEVLIMTLGLNEVWSFKPDGSVFSRSPWRTAPSLVEHKVLTVQENVDALKRLAVIMKEHNPKCKLMVTLSPIPLHATFLGDTRHIVEANAHSKAVLRVAAEEFVQSTENAYYFPSYELVTNCIPDAWAPDQRHVSKETVSKVMAMFKKMYCTG